MKKLIFTLSLMILSLFTYAATFRNYVSHSLSGNTYTIWVNSDTQFGESVQGQICDNGGMPFTGYVVGTFDNSTVMGANWKIVITSAVATPRLELTNINQMNSPYGFTGCNIVMGTVLANELTSFSAAKQANQVNLSWLTAYEKSNENFSIERSKDGQNFSAIGIMKGAFNSTEAKNYAFTDVAPFKGVNYYRLKSTELGGKSAFSKVVSISLLDKNNKTIAYPNPVRESVLRLEHEAISDADLVLRVIDLTGRVIQTEKRSVVNGTNIINLNVANLSSGQYLIAIDEQLIRFVKN